MSSAGAVLGRGAAPAARRACCAQLGARRAARPHGQRGRSRRQQRRAGRMWPALAQTRPGRPAPPAHRGAGRPGAVAHADRAADRATQCVADRAAFNGKPDWHRAAGACRRRDAAGRREDATSSGSRAMFGFCGKYGQCGMCGRYGSTGSAGRTGSTGRTRHMGCTHVLGTRRVGTALQQQAFDRLCPPVGRRRVQRPSAAVVARARVHADAQQPAQRIDVASRGGPVERAVAGEAQARAAAPAAQGPWPPRQFLHAATVPRDHMR